MRTFLKVLLVLFAIIIVAMAYSLPETDEHKNSDCIYMDSYVTIEYQGAMNSITNTGVTDVLLKVTNNHKRPIRVCPNTVIVNDRDAVELLGKETNFKPGETIVITYELTNNLYGLTSVDDINTLSTRIQVRDKESVLSDTGTIKVIGD